MTMNGNELAGQALRHLERADHIANSDNWPGDRGERVADVQTELLRGLVKAGLAIAAELNALTAATYTLAGP